MANLWTAKEIPGIGFYIENGTDSVTDTHAHCKCCALANVLQDKGGSADLRGLHRYGICYQWLAVTSRQNKDEEVTNVS